MNYIGSIPRSGEETGDGRSQGVDQAKQHLEEQVHIVDILAPHRLHLQNDANI